MRRDRGVIILLLLIIFVLYLFKEYVETNGYEKDERYVIIEQKIRTVTNENTGLKQRLYSEKSYITIASEAARLGLTAHRYYVVK